ncbi:hypothetical protein BGS_0520 [Beggiatoa sp. SS]|nr:hypothetical protein BGS_0520 [Beggiatoa sp. SS]
MGTLYDAFLQNQPSPLAPLPIQYVDFCPLATAMGSQVKCLKKQVNYWIEQLAGTPAITRTANGSSTPPGTTFFKGPVYPFPSHRN